MTVKAEICSFGRRSMRKRRESDQIKPKEMKIPSRKTCFIILFLLVLCSWMIPSIAVYGFDVSGMDSFDTGGFDMNVGEGTGQLPEDWEESYAGEGSDDSNWNREEGNTEEYSAAWAESENDQEESAQWNLDFQTDEVRSQEESFMENGNYHFSYTRYEEINEGSEPLGIVVSGPSKITKVGMYNYCWPGCLTVMYDAEYIGLLQIEDIKKNNDYAMWLKVCKKANCYLLDETLAKYRRGRTGSISSHNYKKLISWHYKLFNEAEHKNCVSSALLTVNNLFWGLIKKYRYKEKIK